MSDAIERPERRTEAEIDSTEAEWFRRNGVPVSWKPGDTREGLHRNSRRTTYMFGRPMHWVLDARGISQLRAGRAPGDITIEAEAAKRMLAEFDERERPSE